MGDGSSNSERLPLVSDGGGLPQSGDQLAIQIPDGYSREPSVDQQDINILAFIIKTLYSLVWELTPVLTGKGAEMGDYRYFYSSTYSLVKLTNVLMTRYGKVESLVLDPNQNQEALERLQAQDEWLRQRRCLVQGVDVFLGCSAVLLSILYPVLTLANVAALDPNARTGDFPISKDDFWLAIILGFLGQCVVNRYVWWPFRGGEGKNCVKAWAKIATEFHENKVGHLAAVFVWLINSGVNAMRAQYAWHLALTAYATYGRVFHIDCLEADLQRRLSIASFVLMTIVGGQHMVVDFDRNRKVVCEGVLGSVVDLSLPYLLMACMYAANDMWGTYIVLITLTNRHKGYLQYDCTGPTDHPSHNPSNEWVKWACIAAAVSFTIASYAFNWGTRQAFKAGTDGWSLRTMYRGASNRFFSASTGDDEEGPRILEMDPREAVGSLGSSAV